MTLRAALLVAFSVLVLPGLTGAQRPTLSPAECQAIRDRIREHVSVSAATRRALGITAPAASSAAPSGTQDPATRAETVRARLAQIRDERERLEDEQVGALLKLDFVRVARIKERIEGLEQERRTLEAELAGVEQGRRQARPGPSWMAPLPGPDLLARAPCQDLPALEEKAVKARRWELGGADGQAGVVPLLPLRGQTDRDVAAELATQLGTGPEARQRLGLLDQDGDTQVDGFADSPASGMYRLYRQRPDGSVALDLFLTAAPPPDAPYGEAARRIEEALLRQTRRRLGDLLSLRPAGPVKLLGETGEYSRLRGLADSGQFDQVIQAGGLGARSLELQNYRGETVTLLEVVAGVAEAAQLQTSSILVRPDGGEQREETVTRFRPVSFWRTDVEVDQSREVKPAPSGVAPPRSTTPTVRFSIER